VVGNGNPGAMLYPVSPETNREARLKSWTGFLEPCVSAWEMREKNPGSIAALGEKDFILTNRGSFPWLWTALNFQT